jgi:hypothetical protein
MTHLRQGPLVSHFITFVFKIGFAGEERPRP